MLSWEKLLFSLRFFVLTFCKHSHLLALPESALLAFSAHVHVHLTVPSTFTLIYCILCYTSSEKPCKKAIYVYGCFC